MGQLKMQTLLDLFSYETMMLVQEKVNQCCEHWATRTACLMAHCPGETSGRPSTLSDTQRRYSIFTCAMGTAHRVTPNPTATVLCHGLINSEKQRFLKLVTTGTHCLYLETQVGLRKAGTTNLYVFSSQGLETHTRPSRRPHEDAGSAFQTTGLGGEL